MNIASIEKNCFSSVLDILELHGLGHTGGSLSVLQILISLYFQIARIDPANPKWPERDRIILSKAHACEAMYAVLAERGYIEKEKLKEYLEFGSILQGHTEISTPGVEFSGGSLGQGISFACGMAYAGKIMKRNYRVYAVLGDGECHEGSVWEAAMFASHYRLDNLCAVVDFNHYADHANVDELMNLQPFEEKWKAFGWETAYVDKGNDVGRITEALQNLRQPHKPKCVVANTIKNYGVPTWERLHLHQAFGEMLCKGIREGRELLNER